MVSLRDGAAGDVLPGSLGDREPLLTTIDVGRVVLAADTLGAAQTMLDKAVDYAKERRQFNRVIGSFQAVKHMCSEMAAELEPCRSLLWYAAHAYTAIPEEGRLMACHAKAHLSEVGKSVARKSTEVHGGMGITDLRGCTTGSSGSDSTDSCWGHPSWIGRRRRGCRSGFEGEQCIGARNQCSKKAQR